MNIHDLAGYVVRALCKSDDLRRKPWKGSPNVFAGHCYVASEVLYHMGGEEMGLRPAFIRHEGQPHWFLMMPNSSCLLDVTVAQFKTNPDYTKARGKGFLTKAPSKRACVLMQRVSHLLQEEAGAPVAHKHIRSQFVQGHVEARVTIKPARPVATCCYIASLGSHLLSSDGHCVGCTYVNPEWRAEHTQLEGAHDFVPQGTLWEYSKCSKCGAYSDGAEGRKPCPRSGG